MESFMNRVANLLLENGSLKLITVLNGSADGRDITAQKMILLDDMIVQDESLRGFWNGISDSLSPAELPCVKKVGSSTIFAEHLTAGERLIICGGGHIGEVLAKIGVLLDFDVTVIDDRPDFANEQRFPEVQQIICKPYAEALEEVVPTSNDYFVIVTSGHIHDGACLEKILQGSFAYVGMIGSARKVSIKMKELLDKGFSQTLLDRVHTPIGLKIGAQTPAEIAVCIAAEVIQVKQTTDASACVPDAILNELAEGTQPLAMATITEKEGSAPRGVGAKMLVRADGRIFGTIGGGGAEAQACKLAAEVLATGKPILQKFDMTNTDPFKPLMICGGVITVFIERIQ